MQAHGAAALIPAGRAALVRAHALGAARRAVRNRPQRAEIAAAPELVGAAHHGDQERDGPQAARHHRFFQKDSWHQLAAKILVQTSRSPTLFSRYQRRTKLLRRWACPLEHAAREQRRGRGSHSLLGT